MRTTARVLSLAFVVLVLCAASQAGCYSYLEYGPYACVGPNGCYDSYYRTICAGGCVAGDCYSQGGSGECCGKLYYNATIYPDPWYRCGGSCGELPVIASASSTRM